MTRSLFSSKTVSKYLLEHSSLHRLQTIIIFRAKNYAIPWKFCLPMKLSLLLKYWKCWKKKKRIEQLEPSKITNSKNINRSAFDTWQRHALNIFAHKINEGSVPTPNIFKDTIIINNKSNKTKNLLRKLGSSIKSTLIITIINDPV